MCKMTNDLQINTKPTLENLAEIKNWLIQEYEETSNGFFCNWNIIENAFKNNELIILEKNKLIISFIVFTNNEMYIEIDILEVNPNQRKLGFGKIFFDKVCENFKKQNIKAVKLFCEPKESELFWKKMNFIKFPNIGYSISELTYFKPLIEINNSIIGSSKNKFELWDLEPYQIKDNKPKWTWEIEANGRVFKPIIQPCNSNWNLRLTINDNIVKEDKVKRFSSKENVYEYGHFLYIGNLI